MHIGLLSDTHGFLEPAIFDYLGACDEVWHAGDFGPISIFDQLAAFKPLRGVWGNIDGQDIRACVPQDLVWECAGMRVYMTHIGGYPGAYGKRVKAEIEKSRPGLFICGHSHIVKVMRDQKLGLIHLNPGAAGQHGWHIMRTLLRFTIEDGKLNGLEVVELGPRGRQNMKARTSS